MGRTRRLLRFLGRLVLLGLIVGGAAAFVLLQPVRGPARDLTLVADVSRGDYLIRLGGCVACHTDTKNKGAFLAGGAPIVTPFGSFVPPNITPDPQAGIGGWTLADFSAAMSDGVGPGGKHYYPAFPYENYTRMSDQEIVDLWAALQKVAPVAARAGEHQLGFPFNVRLAMGAWQTLFFHPARFAPVAGKSEAWNRGNYLVNGPAHCVACHTPRNLFGASEADKPLAGSPKDSLQGAVPAITKANLLALGYDHAGLVDVLDGGVTPSFDVPGGAMAEVIFEGTTHWTPEDREAVATYLLDAE